MQLFLTSDFFLSYICSNIYIYIYVVIIEPILPQAKFEKLIQLMYNYINWIYNQLIEN